MTTKTTRTRKANYDTSHLKAQADGVGSNLPNRHHVIYKVLKVLTRAKKGELPVELTAGSIGASGKARRGTPSRGYRKTTVDPSKYKDVTQYDPNHLPPKAHYTTGEHDYHYFTDGQGRIEHVQAPKLQLKVHQGRLRNKTNTLEKMDGDDAGHLIADQFGGSPDLDNLLSQNRQLNQQGGWKQMEEHWASVLKDNGRIEDVHIYVEYEGDSKRPAAYHVDFIEYDKRGKMIPHDPHWFENSITPPRKGKK